MKEEAIILLHKALDDANHKINLREHRDTGTQTIIDLNTIDFIQKTDMFTEASTDLNSSQSEIQVFIRKVNFNLSK